MNNPTIDGVSREFLERIRQYLIDIGEIGEFGAELFQLLNVDAPAVKRQEFGDPVGSFDKHMEYMQENIRLQSTIAQLQARVQELENETAVVLPERKEPLKIVGSTYDDGLCDGWNACIDATAALSKVRK